MAESPLKAWKSSYAASVRGVFGGIEGRYPRLRPLQVQRDEGGTIPYSGTLLEQAEVSLSSERYSPSSIQDLFVPDSSGFVPRTVVLVGPPGIGKTRTAQKVLLDWASGILFRDTFHYVFYLSAQEINKIEGNVNLLGLVVRSSALQCPEGLIKAAFNDPSKVLLVLDGFDELRWTLEEDYEDYEDPLEDTHKETLLRCLLSNELVEECCLLVTSRTMCLRKMKDYVQSPTSIELLGFSREDVEHYLQQAEVETCVLRDNEVLGELCSIPLTCHLVCYILKAGMMEELSSCTTLTSVYLLYLKSLLSNPVDKQPALECLKKLCAMAKQGVESQRSSFSLEDLSSFSLTPSEVASVFPNDGILRKATDYVFLHLSVQEFLAALYYVLCEESKGASADTYLPNVCKERSVCRQSEYYPHLSGTLRFLCGLLNDLRVEAVIHSLGYNASFRAKAAVNQWLTSAEASRFCTEAFMYLYEAQDVELCRGAFGVPHVEIQQSAFYSAMVPTYTREMLYCLPNPPTFNSMTLEDHLMRPPDLTLLSPILHQCAKLSFIRCGFSEDGDADLEASWLSNPHSKVQELEFHVCVVTPAFFQDLGSFVSLSRSLSKLVISHHKLDDSSLEILSDALRHPSCALRQLELNDCSLTASSCKYLGSALGVNASLEKLELVLNELGDEGVKFLCEGLKDERCCLQELRIEFSELSPACCEFLRSALMTNKTLTTLYMRECNLQDAGTKLLCDALCQPGSVLKKLGLPENNLSAASCQDLQLLLTNKTLFSLDLMYNDIQDSGMKLLCEALCDPGCTLQELRLTHCALTSASCRDLRSVLVTNRSLIKLQLTWNKLEDCGVPALCEGLRGPHCILQELDLSGCGLTSSSLEELTSVITTNRSLLSLDVSGNKYDEAGVRGVWAALRGPNCSLQELSVGYCQMSESCAEDFLSVINTNSSLKKLDVSFSYEDEEPPADLDVMCRRFEHPACTLRKNDTQDGMFIYFTYSKPK